MLAVHTHRLLLLSRIIILQSRSRRCSRPPLICRVSAQTDLLMKQQSSPLVCPAGFTLLSSPLFIFPCSCVFVEGLPRRVCVWSNASSSDDNWCVRVRVWECFSFFFTSPEAYPCRRYVCSNGCILAAKWSEANLQRWCRLRTHTRTTCPLDVLCQLLTEPWLSMVKGDTSILPNSFGKQLIGCFENCKDNNTSKTKWNNVKLLHFVTLCWKSIWRFPFSALSWLQNFY